MVEPNSRKFRVKIEQRTIVTHTIKEKVTIVHENSDEITLGTVRTPTEKFSTSSRFRTEYLTMEELENFMKNHENTENIDVRRKLNDLVNLDKENEKVNERIKVWIFLDASNVF